MRLIVMALAAAVALGAGPALADEAAPAKEAKGKELFLKYNCNSCHTVASQSIARKAAAAEAKEAAPAKEAAATKEAAPAAEASSKRKVPDLSAVGVDKKADWIAKYLQKLEAIKEKKHMKKFAGTTEELTEISAWLEAQKDVEAAKKATEGGAAPAKDETKSETTEAKEAPKTE